MSGNDRTDSSSPSATSWSGNSHQAQFLRAGTGGAVQPESHPEFPASMTYIPSKPSLYFESYNPTFQYQKRKILSAWNQSASLVSQFNPFLSQASSQFPRYLSQSRPDVVSEVENPLELIKLQLFIRHGPRTFMTALPNYNNFYGEFPWKCPPFVTEFLQDHHFFKSDLVINDKERTKDLSFNLFYQSEDNRIKGNCGQGQLTAIGWNYMERIGSFLRYRYGKLDPSETYIRTTDSHPRRTEDTTKAVLMGWMPEISSWNIFRVENSMEYFYNRESHCPRLKVLLRQFKESEIARLENQRVEKYIDPIIRRALNLAPSKPLPSARAFYNTIDCLLTDGKPFFVTQSELQDIEEHAIWYYKSRYSSADRILGKLSISRVFDLVLQNIDAKLARDQKTDHIYGPIRIGAPDINNTNLVQPFISRNINTHPSNRLSEIYICHDQTLLPMLACMNQKSTRWTGFGSWIAFETFHDKNTDDYYIRVVWDGQTLDLSKDLKGNVILNEVTEYPELRHLYRYQDFRNWCLGEVVLHGFKEECTPIPGEILFPPPRRENAEKI